MDVALFIPCYVDQLAPDVARATARVLERAGCRVSYDPNQTCCGQPFLNQGFAEEARRLGTGHLARFRGGRVSVAPSASCVATIRHRYAELGIGGGPEDLETCARTFELGEFLVNELGRVDVGAAFPHKVALLQSCHGLRELGLGAPSELGGGASPPPGPTEALLRAVRGLELRLPDRPDECCGFGGGFSTEFPEVSARIGRDRMRALADTGAEFVTGTDVSCLMHLEGIRRRAGYGPRPIHLAEILDTSESS